MQKDMLQSIDDSALETVSGGGVGGHIAAHIREHAEHAIGHFREAADFVGDVTGAVLKHTGSVLERIGSKLAD
jgi:hypothetical protein